MFLGRPTEYSEGVGPTCWIFFVLIWLEKPRNLFDKKFLINAPKSKPTASQLAVATWRVATGESETQNDDVDKIYKN